MRECYAPRLVLFLGMSCIAVVLLAGPPAWARPSAMKLLPEETLLLVEAPNLHALWQKFRETSGGRMVRDPQLAPLVERLYGSAGDLYAERLAEILGVSWEELQELPQGEVAFAIVGRREGKPVFVLLVDQGEEPSVTPRLLDTARERLLGAGGETTTESIAGQEVTVVRVGDDWLQSMGMFEREHTIVASNDPGVLGEVLRHWNTADAEAGAAAATDNSQADEASESVTRQFSGQTLAENQKFVTILRSCRRAHDPPPNLILYVDPIGLVRQFNRDNAGMAVAMATFPALGIDGLAGIGVTMTFATERFDGLTHMHVLLENPRAGVMQVIAFEPGDTMPEPWVFAELENYITWNWNVRTSFNVIRSLVDRFQYEGATDKFVAQQISERHGIDFEAEVIDNIAGRFNWITAFERPARFRGGQSTLAIKVVDEELAKKTLANFVAKHPDSFATRQFGDVTYQAIVIEWPEELRDDPPTTPLLAVVDGYFFLGGSCQLFERAIAARDGTVERLVDQANYQQLAIEVQQETPGITPAVWMYNRPAESIRQWYDVLTSEKTKAYLSEHAEGNPFFAALVDAMAANELPPFEALEKYFPPTVGVIYDTDTGFHGISFSPQLAAEE